jgi:hypothetical protein
MPDQSNYWPVRVKGGAAANYETLDDDRTRMAKCIAFELQHGGDALAAAKALLRDMELGHIRLPIDIVCSNMKHYRIASTRGTH